MANARTGFFTKCVRGFRDRQWRGRRSSISLNKAVIEAALVAILLSTSGPVNTNSDLTTDDGSPGHNLCLRQAISQADAAGDNQTINIASSLAGSTITLNERRFNIE